MCDDKSLSLAEAASDCAEHADWLYEHCSAREQYDYVQLKNFNESQDPELLWRFGRACDCLYTFSSASKEEKAAAIRDGLKAAQKAVEIDSKNSSAFLVLGRLTGSTAELCAYRSPIQSCKLTLECRDHFKHATELDPNNHEAWFSLGAWSYNVLSRAFYEKLVFYQVTGFTPDLNEGIDMLKKSNEILPQPITSLYIGKCYLYVKQNDEAKKWLETASNFQSSQTEGAVHTYSKRDALQQLRGLK